MFMIVYLWISGGFWRRLMLGLVDNEVSLELIVI